MFEFNVGNRLKITGFKIEHTVYWKKKACRKWFVRYDLVI